MKKIFIRLLAVLLLIAGGVVYYNFNPASSSGWAPTCTFHELTSYNCPGCGGQRALHSLLHGHILEAMRFNILYALGFPFLVYLYFFCVEVYILGNKKLSANFLFSPRTGIIIAITVVVFFLLRNIPVWPFIYLSPP